MSRNNEKGMALVMVIILLVVLSVMATSLMFLAQTETWSSVNYRLMTQSRYGAEAGINQAVNYILNSYTPPATGGGDPLSNYVTNATGVTFPTTNGDLVGVTYNNQAVVLSSNPAVASNYPVSSVKSTFNSSAAGSLTADYATVTYSAYAVLLSMRTVTSYGTATPTTIQTWRITGDASIAGAQTALVEVSSILERQSFPENSYAMFAASATCGAITFSGNASIQSYDSSNITYSGGNVVTQMSGGNVGTNGNFTESGSTTVYGSLSSPRSGVGTCNSANPDAWTSSGKATVQAGMIHLPQPIVYPTPALPIPTPPVTSMSMTKNSTCVGLGLGITSCTSSVVVGAVGIALVPGTQAAPNTYGNISMSGGGTIHFTPGYYNINSLTLSGNSSIVIDPNPVTGQPGQVIINIAGQGTNSPVDLSGGTLVNSPPIPLNFQLLYAGTGSINITGGSAAAGLIYAPNASFKSSGGTTWYGEVISNTVTDTGGTTFVYDRSLATSFATVTNPALSSFTWKKY